MENKLLTIGIPTYNRIEKLKKTIKGIEEQVIKLKEIDQKKIEIVISDNASTDGSFKFLRDFNETTKINLRLNLNKENEGYDANCDKVFQKSSGKFVWLLSDDDEFDDNLIEVLLKSVEKNKEIGFCFIDYRLSTKFNHTTKKTSKSEFELVDTTSLINKTKFAFSFVSSCVFRRDLWMKADRFAYIGTNWIHLYIFREVMQNEKSMIIKGKKLIMNAVSIEQSRKRASESLPKDANCFYMDAHLNFIKYTHGYKDYGYGELTNKIIDIPWNDNLRQIIYYKITQKCFRYREVRKIIYTMHKYFNTKIRFWLLDVPLLFFPSKALKFLLKLLKRDFT